MKRMRKTLILAISLMFTGGTAVAESCQSWQDVRPYVQKFFTVDGRHSDALIKNFNAMQPRTDFHPDMVGYAWFGGEKIVKLYMVANGCVIVDRFLPRHAVWQMMAGHAAATDIDKSGERYAKILQEHNAAQDKAWANAQKKQQTIFETDEAMSEEELIQSQDIN